MEEVPSPDDENQNLESLAGAPLDPVAEPSTLARKLSKGAMLLLGTAGAGVLVLFSLSATTCLGATRSYKLKWQQRQAEIERAEAETQASTDRRD